MRILGLAEDKIEVIYPGIAEPYFQTSSSDARTAAGKFGLVRPYILFVGTIEPRKNLDVLLDAYGQLPKALGAEFDLVIAGPAGWAAPHTLARLRSGAPGVRYLGYVPEKDLPGLTAGASVFVYPSLYEGFGLPVAQAMAAGAPVITSDISSMPEVAGGAAVLVDPRSVSEVRAAITRLLLSPETRDELRNQGLARARRFTWDAYAQKSLVFFRRIGGLS